ncbi:glycosyl Hydrolase Family 88 [Diaporthe helianthi]|uniref:Glycosyl Hydrolase Family 88 n=1 Tax=Diaporthe helianthi TaxID=158607 RepID=A0A2P5HQ44_DIAHE|nr:glycosyl Hydrolase Family 88 [Diaporthe helianthi]
MRVFIGRLAVGVVLVTAHPILAAGAVFARNVTKNSIYMASSLIARNDGIMTGEGGSSEPLQAGFTQKAFTALLDLYPGNDEVREHISASVDSVLPYLSNATENALSYPLDRLSNGNAMLSFSQQPLANAQTSAYTSGLEALRLSIDLNRRNQEDGLWYYTYPYWSYLDGMYSLAPFYTLYTVTQNNATTLNETALDDMAHQINLLWDHCLDENSGLLVHGYDASGTAVWADPVTGASPHVWSRSLGWYFMALVDTLEVLQDHRRTKQYREPLLHKFRSLATAVTQAVDPDTGAWWQVLDQAGREGNYIESSGSAMFTYALLKGARLGYLGPGNMSTASTQVAKRAHDYLTDNFVVREANGTLGYNGTVAVCSLNSTASYEYYISQPIKYNSVLGSAAYILASVEIESLQDKCAEA